MNDEVLHLSVGDFFLRYRTLSLPQSPWVRRWIDIVMKEPHRSRMLTTRQDYSGILMDVFFSLLRCGEYPADEDKEVMERHAARLGPRALSSYIYPLSVPAADENRREEATLWRDIRGYLEAPEGRLPPSARCPVCFDALAIIGIPPSAADPTGKNSRYAVAMHCGHMMCRRCWLQMMLVQMGAKQQLHRMRCPVCRFRLAFQCLCYAKPVDIPDFTGIQTQTQSWPLHLIESDMPPHSPTHINELIPGPCASCKYDRLPISLSPERFWDFQTRLPYDKHFWKRVRKAALTGKLGWGGMPVQCTPAYRKLVGLSDDEF
ncbi:hypothetical protein B0T24DRAFT_591046 [Lasiosphaeria ovina]|uniref:RING-type domain-containing protein n=1 Tax=Lasiosphaeria ovina TaxID=92902 RepID=A0AAE0TUT2_9PEZI|nr:hypothetical protein B0T24DRAFT_591046 [Lasiosphaeria ovina]